MARVRIDALEKRYVARGRPVDALRGFSLDVADGSCTAVLGPSGCGKTTLLRVVAGLERPDSGVVSFDGRDVTRTAPDRRGVGMVFAQDALFPHRSAYENIAYGLHGRGYDAAERDRRIRDAAWRTRAHELLERSARSLSGGERQRVAIARALAPEPAIVLLDEPFSRLDAPLRAALRAELRRALHDTRATALFVTHDQAEAMALADAIAVVRDGAVEQCASPRDVYDTPATAYVAAFVGSPAMSFVPARAVAFADDAPGAVRFGFRADAVRIGPDADLSGIVRAVEDFGADAFAFVETADGEIVARGATLPRVGERVGLAFDRSRAHPFDAGGRRVDAYARV
ncbi:MAG: ABC transporter ATP-binding protein [Candidatus Eremiobacteraeota bacterium]|nr:ABC transporter ATP-binding protein [Candidatus Eremiobacteraeota bacterium]